MYIRVYRRKKVEITKTSVLSFIGKCITDIYTICTQSPNIPIMPPFLASTTLSLFYSKKCLDLTGYGKTWSDLKVLDSHDPWGVPPPPPPPCSPPPPPFSSFHLEQQKTNPAMTMSSLHPLFSYKYLPWRISFSWWVIFCSSAISPAEPRKLPGDSWKYKTKPFSSLIIISDEETVIMKAMPTNLGVNLRKNFYCWSDLFLPVPDPAK